LQFNSHGGGDGRFWLPLARLGSGGDGSVDGAVVG